MRRVAVVAGAFPRQPLAARVVEDDDRDVTCPMCLERRTLVLDDPFHLALQVEIEGGHDVRRRRRASARVRRSHGEGGHHLDEVRCVERAAARRQRDLFGASLAQALRTERAGGRHPAENRLLPEAGRRHVLARIERARPLWQRREKGRLRGRQHGCIHAKVQPARPPGPGRLVAVRRQVQVHREDVALAEAMLQAERQHRLTELHGDPAMAEAFAPLDEELRDLLGNRRAPFNDVPFGQVVTRGAQEGYGIDAGMRIEAAILRRQCRRLEHRRQARGLERANPGAVPRQRLVQHAAVTIHHYRGRRVDSIEQPRRDRRAANPDGGGQQQRRHHPDHPPMHLDPPHHDHHQHGHHRCRGGSRTTHRISLAGSRPSPALGRPLGGSRTAPTCESRLPPSPYARRPRARTSLPRAPAPCGTSRRSSRARHT